MVQRNNKKNKTSHTFKLWHPLKQALPLALIAATVMGGMAWAGSSQIKSIDFEPGVRGLDIVVHGSEKVPVKKIFVSDKKLVLDLDHVNSSQSIKTNFSQMGSISHVVMQPLSKDKIRLIIRGEDLGRPQVSFQGAGYKPSLKEQLPYPLMEEKLKQKDALKPIAEEIAEDTLEEGSDSSKDLLEEDGDWLGQAETSLDEMATSNDGLDAVADDNAEDFILPAVEVDETVENESNAISRPSIESEAPIRVSESGDWMESLGFISQINMADTVKYGVLLVLLIGLIMFIQSKSAKLQNAQVQQKRRFNPNDQQAYAPQQQGFDGYSQAGYQDLNYQQPSQMIGLGRLRPQQMPYDQVNPAAMPQRQAQRPAPKPAHQPGTLSGLAALKNRANAAKAKPMMTPPAGKQVLNQYQKQAGSLTGSSSVKRNPMPPKNRTTSTDMLKQELHRSRDVQQQVMGRKAPQQQAFSNVGKPNASMKNNSSMNAAMNARTLKTHGDEPLPGNPQVLDFLKDVADLMEKEGKSNIAQTIHKNMHLR